MNDTATLLRDFGFTIEASKKIARSAHKNNLTPADVQAWIDEARSSTSLHNPLGFVRARLQSGDKLPPRSSTDPHTTSRHHYVTQFTHPDKA